MTNTTINHTVLAEAYRELREELLRLLLYKTGNEVVAEDLLHDVFRKALAATQDKVLPSNLSGWLYTITKNTLTDFYRTQKPSLALPEDLANEEEEMTVIMALKPCLLPFIRQLPEIYQDALIAADIEERPLQKVANEQKVSLSAIKSRVSRGRQQLKALLLGCCEITLQRSGAIDDFKQKQPQCGCSE